MHLHTSSVFKATIIVCVALTVFGMVFFQFNRRDRRRQDDVTFLELTTTNNNQQQQQSPSPVAQQQQPQQPPQIAPASVPVPSPATLPPQPVVQPQKPLTSDEAAHVDLVLNRPLKEKIESLKTSRNEILITTATFGFRHFLFNWLCSIKQFGLDKHLLIYTVDRKLAEELILHHGVEDGVYLDSTNRLSEEGSLSYGSMDYINLMMYRTQFIRHILVDHNVRVLLVDNDAIWFKDPLEYIVNNYKGKDLVGQNDSMASKEGKRPMVCGGFIYLNTTVTMKRVWTDLTNLHTRNVKANKNTGATEQILLNSMTRRLNHALLPWQLFPSGYIFFHEPSRERSTIFKDIHVLHNNWVIGEEAKLQRFKDNGFWFLDEHQNCVENISPHIK